MTEPAAAPESQAIDQLSSLEERIVQVVQLLQEARQARQAAAKEAAGLRGELLAKEGELAALRQQLAAHNKERDEVRRRLEGLLQQVDSLVSR
jgi:chromosome segregation ATPase